MMDLRRGLMMGMAQNEDWTYVIKPTNSADKIIQSVQTRLEAGQTITIEWSADDGYAMMTNKYLWRCLGSGLDGSGAGYAAKTMYGLSGKTGSETHTVSAAGNFQIGGYANGIAATSFIGDFIKVKITPAT